MFDIGFWELAVIGVIALLVVGPDRLPALARNVGLWVGRIRRYVSHVKQDIERELHADEVRQLIEKPDELDGLRDIAKQTASVFEDTRNALDDAGRVGSTAGGDAGAGAQGAAGPAVPDAGKGAASTSAPQALPDPDPTPSAASVPDDEQQPERQGQR